MSQTVKICGLSTAADAGERVARRRGHGRVRILPKKPASCRISRRRGNWQARPTQGRNRRAMRRPGRRAAGTDRSGDGAGLCAIARLRKPRSSQSISSVSSVSPRSRRLAWRRRDDLAKADHYAGKSDALLIDAKPPNDAVTPGGNGVAFDWRIAADFNPRKPWLLSGGLSPSNVAAAIELSGTRGIDVSSGVESAPGVKDPDKIKAFIDAALAAFERQDQEFCGSQT